MDNHFIFWITLLLTTGLGDCAQIPKLDNGAAVSGADLAANTNGAASVGVIVDNGSNVACNGVMLTLTTFVTSHFCNVGGNPNDLQVFVGGLRYALPTASFDGNVLNVSVLTPYQPLINYTTDQIPTGSLAVPAILNPKNSPIPGPNAECFAFGYGTATDPKVLNTRPATVTTYAECTTSYSLNPDDGTTFCAKIKDDAGGDGCQSSPDAPLILMCRQGVGKRRAARQMGDFRTGNSTDINDTVQRCYATGFWFWCQHLCAGTLNLLPFCNTVGESVTAPAPFYLADSDGYRICLWSSTTVSFCVCFQPCID